MGLEEVMVILEDDFGYLLESTRRNILILLI